MKKMVIVRTKVDHEAAVKMKMSVRPRKKEN